MDVYSETFGLHPPPIWSRLATKSHFNCKIEFLAEYISTILLYFLTKLIFKLIKINNLA